MTFLYTDTLSESHIISLIHLTEFLSVVPLATYSLCNLWCASSIVISRWDGVNSQSRLYLFVPIKTWRVWVRFTKSRGENPSSKKKTTTICCSMLQGGHHSVSDFCQLLVVSFWNKSYNHFTFWLCGDVSFPICCYAQLYILSSLNDFIILSMIKHFSVLRLVVQSVQLPWHWV